MTESMVERVARAICRSKGIDPDMCVAGSGGAPGVMSVCHQYAWELEKPCARAAIEAMREPTREMVMACGEHQGCKHTAYGRAMEVWRDMIDSALESHDGEAQKG